jgi:hypothetical protein
VAGENGEATIEAVEDPNGQVTAEELGVLYHAAVIENRMFKSRIAGLEQQVAVAGGLLAQVAAEVGVDDPTQIIPALRKLKKNRAQRRSEKAAGGRKRS